MTAINDVYARRLAQPFMFQQLYRSLPLIWNATQVTREPFNLSLVKEELMRVNGNRAMPVLLAPANAIDCHLQHLASLEDNCTWASSFRACTTRKQTVSTVMAGMMGRMEMSLPAFKASETIQLLVQDEIQRAEGVCSHESFPQS